MTTPKPPSVSRRRLLGGAAAVAVAMPALAVSTAVQAPEPIHPDDARLVRLWHRLMKVDAMREENRRQRKAAVTRVPEWARWERAEWGGYNSDPAWTPAMLRRHGIPENIGRRPSWKDIEELNAADLRAACRATIRPDLQDIADFGAAVLAWSYGEERANVPPYVAAVKEANARRMGAYRRRLAARRREEARVGLTALEERRNRLWEVADAIQARIVDAPAHGAAGALVKLRTWYRNALDEAGGTPDDLDHYGQLVAAALAVLEKTAAAKVLADPFSGTADMFGSEGEEVAHAPPTSRSIKPA